ncbi:TPA: LPXTG cell wall anchor domain-containing protein, partial [Streptococcus pneumoniae]
TSASESASTSASASVSTSASASASTSASASASTSASASASTSVSNSANHSNSQVGNTSGSTGKSQKELPNTGTESSIGSVLLGVLEAVTGIGLVAKRRKRDEEE